MDEPNYKFEKHEKPIKITNRLAIAFFVMAISVITIGAYYITGRNLNRLIYDPMENMKACGNNMSQLCSALRAYASNKDGSLPEESRWCDILREEIKVSQDTFICQISDTQSGQSSYTLNENIVGMKLSEIPRDVILLFESIPGWNQTGGPELVRRNNHILADSEYFNVIFAGGRVEHCPINRIQELKWKP